MVAQKKLQASITVEAVFVFPIVLFIVIALMYASFYMHDKSVIQSVLDEANERFSMAVKQPTDYASGEISYDLMTERSLLCRYNGDFSVETTDMKSYISDALKRKLMLSEVSSIEVEKDTFSVEIILETKSRISFGPALTYLTSIQTSGYEAENELYDPSEYARAASITLDLASQIKGYDKIVDVINKINNQLN